jgi:hypothetical protein
MLCVVGLAGLLTSCAPVATLTTLPDPNVEVKVAGSPAQFAAFDKALQLIIGTEPLGCSVKIGGTVSPCSALQASPVPSNATELTYVFLGSHTFVYDRFGNAFDQVAKQYGPPNLPTLTIRPIQERAPDCGGLPSPCRAAPYCPQYLGCSKTQFPCQKC